MFLHKCFQIRSTWTYYYYIKCQFLCRTQNRFNSKYNIFSIDIHGYWILDINTYTNNKWVEKTWHKRRIEIESSFELFNANLKYLLGLFFFRSCYVLSMIYVYILMIILFDWNSLFQQIVPMLIHFKFLFCVFDSIIIRKSQINYSRGHFTNIWNVWFFFSFSSIGEPITLKPDVYKYDFELALPADLPTSMEGSYGSIRYKAILTINVPIWPDKVFENCFSVIKPVNLNEMFELKVEIILYISLCICQYHFAVECNNNNISVGLDKCGKAKGVLPVLSAVLLQNITINHCCEIAGDWFYARSTNRFNPSSRESK